MITILKLPEIIYFKLPEIIYSKLLWSRENFKKKSEVFEFKISKRN